MIYSNRKKNQDNKIFMREKFLMFFFSILFLSSFESIYSQGEIENTEEVKTILDSLKKVGVIFNGSIQKPEISLSKEQAIRFLQERTQPQFWIDSEDPFRLALNKLIYEASNPKYDSAAFFLWRYPYDSLLISWDKFYIWEPLHLSIPVISAPKFPLRADTLLVADTSLVKNMSDSLIIMPYVPGEIYSDDRFAGLKDTTIMVVTDTLHEVKSSISGFPFRYLNFPFQGDSIQVAVNLLLKYLEERDSSIINFTGNSNVVIPVWMNAKSSTMTRYWLKNEISDSVLIWIGNPSRNTIGLYLEQGVSFRRTGKQGNYSDPRINVKPLDNSRLLETQKIVVLPQYWKFRTEAAFVFSQSALTNWVKGGENSISSLLDITGYADYNNKHLKISSSNFGRIKLGFQKSGDNPVRKNVDIIETNSKINHKAFGKFDFSAVMLFKTQLAPGYSYAKVNNKDTAVLVSKMFNPVILTLGFGLDFKPNKKTSINFSPLSYKGTYVTDTIHIDQTKYGISKDKKSFNEPGASFMISNEFKPSKNITLTNRLQLFTNYIHNPMNIDVDWEMIGVVNLNWFTDIRFNTHLIFDDDTKTVVLDDDNKPVLRPDGTLKKTARIQFKEMLGISLVFRF